MKRVLIAAFILSGIAVTANAQTESKIKTGATEKQVVHRATPVRKLSSRSFTKKTDVQVVNGNKQRPTATPAPSVARKRTLTKEMLKKKGFTKENIKPE